MEKPIVIRQGDVLFCEVDAASINQNSIREVSSDDSKAGIFARGESTGHSHRLAALESAVILESWRDRFVRVGEQDAQVVHEEHRTVVLPAKRTFQIHQAREFDYTANLVRTVTD